MWLCGNAASKSSTWIPYVAVERCTAIPELEEPAFKSVHRANVHLASFVIGNL